MISAAELASKVSSKPILENADGALDGVGKLVLKRRCSEAALVRLGQYSNNLELDFRYYQNCIPVLPRRKIYGLFRHKHEVPEDHSSALELLNHMWRERNRQLGPWELADHDDLLVFGISEVSKACLLPVVAPGGHLGSHVPFIARRGDKRCLEHRDANWPWKNNTYFLVTRSPASQSRWTGF